MKSGKSKNRTPAPASSALVAPIQKALELHQAGRLQEAESLYRQILRDQPRHQDAHNLLGFLLHQRGERDEAIVSIQKAIALDPGQPLFHNNLGIVYQNHGKPAEAIACYQKALKLDPRYQAALGNLGTLHQSQGRFDEAIACQEQALKLDPNFFEAHANLGNIHCEQKRFPEAIAAYQTALKHKPDYVNAMHNMAYVLQKLEQYDDAIQWLEKALAIRPDYLEALNCLGNVLQDLGRWQEATACYQKALAFNPRYHEALCNMGNVLCDQGRLDESIACHQQALAIKPDLHESYTHMANALQLQERMDEAIACYHQALAIKPGDETALENLGVACNVQGDLEGAIDCTRQLLAKKKDDPNLIASLLNLLRQICDWQDCPALFDDMMQRFNQGNKLINPFVFLTLPTTPAEQKACAEYYIHRKYRARRNLAAQPNHDPHPRRIRIGYLSCDFLNHATAILMAEMIKLHDRERFEIFIYSYGDNDGKEMRQRIVETCDRFVDLKNVDHENAARQIHADGVHILVELKGFTKGARLEISAQRPAPLQISWLGYPGTMGAPHIDYVVADPFIIPHGQEHHYSEQVVRLPHCYQPNDRLRALPESGPSREACGLPATGLIFSNFNQTYKITPEIFAAWMEVLRQVPESILWLLESNPLVADNLRREAEKRGMDPARIHFAPKLGVAEHLARYHLVDLVLDTFPVTSHTTASDALWIGCPLVTIAGDTFVSRVAGSLLHAIGAPELVATNLEEYVSIALELARNPERLQALRTRIQSNRATSPLFDTPRFTRDLEAVFETIWQRHEAGETPTHLDIPPSFASPESPIRATPTLAPTRPATPVAPPPAPAVTPPFATMPRSEPIALSICVTTESGRAWLPHTLEHLKWTLTTPRAIEILVVTGPEATGNEAMIRNLGSVFPRFRHVTLPRVLSGPALAQAALRSGQGAFRVHLESGDRLIPEILLEELDLMTQDDRIVASHAPWRLWNDATGTDLGLFYPLEEPVIFERNQAANLFNFIALNHIFPEVAIHRAETLVRVSFDLQATYGPVVTTFRANAHGTIRFQPRPFLLSVLRHPTPGAAHTKPGTTSILDQLDHYRSGLEIAASLALSSIGMPDFDPGNRSVVLDLINDFTVRRILVAANIAQANQDYIAASLCLKRALLWSKTEPDRQYIRDLEPTVLIGAAYQALKERFETLPGANSLVCCGVSNPAVVQDSLRQIAPALPVEVRDPATAVGAADRSACLHLTESEEIRATLIQAGVPIDRVVMTTDLLAMFRVTA
ncbi:MAG: tetratricopeptide repeat protein [Magnetococcales bacterium]|nr:tetratricopeptide repeat protein [Magnetococcales bacterium]